VFLALPGSILLEDNSVFLASLVKNLIPSVLRVYLVQQESSPQGAPIVPPVLRVNSLTTPKLLVFPVRLGISPLPQVISASLVRMGRVQMMPVRCALIVLLERFHLTTDLSVATVPQVPLPLIVAPSNVSIVGQELMPTRTGLNALNVLKGLIHRVLDHASPAREVRALALVPVHVIAVLVEQLLPTVHIAIQVHSPIMVTCVMCVLLEHMPDPVNVSAHNAGQDLNLSMVHFVPLVRLDIFLLEMEIVCFVL